MTSTITSKGQTTIPKDVREHMGVSAGGKIKFIKHPDGTVYILPVLPMSALTALLPPPYKGRPKTIEEMDEGIAEAVAARDRRSKQR